MQNEEAADLRAAHSRLRAERAVDFVHMLCDQIIDERMAGKLLIGRVSDVVPLGPVPHRDQIDVDEAGDGVAPVAEGDRFLDVGIEFQLVLDIFRREQRAVRQAADILGAVDDLEMAAGFEETRIAGTHEAICGFGFGGLLIVLVVADEDAGRAIEDFAILIDADFDLRGGAPNSVGADFSVGMHRT